MSRCGESGLFESRHSVKNKKLFHQTVKELFVVGVTGFELLTFIYRLYSLYIYLRYINTLCMLFIA